MAAEPQHAPTVRIKADGLEVDARLHAWVDTPRGRAGRMTYWDAAGGEPVEHRITLPRRYIELLDGQDYSRVPVEQAAVRRTGRAPSPWGWRRTG